MKMFQSVRSRSRQRIEEDDLGLHLDVHARRPAAVDAVYHDVVVAHGEQTQRNYLEVLPLERPVEQGVDEALATPVGSSAGQLGDLGDHHVRIGVLEEPLDVSVAVRPEQLVQQARELGRDAVLDRRGPLVAHVKVPQDLADGFQSVLHRSQPVGPKRSVRIALGSKPGIEQQAAGGLDESVRSADERECRRGRPAPPISAASMRPVWPRPALAAARA